MADKKLILKTRSESLQHTLQVFVAALEKIESLPASSAERKTAVETFSRLFVPSDCTEDDLSYFTENLLSDEEYFQSLSRDVKQCCSGKQVEKIEGDQQSRAVFTLLPQEGTISSDCALDIVREVSFISCDGGASWHAEG